jgi:hypothetical protein
MTPDEVELIRDVISEAVQVSTEYALDEGSAIVEAFLDAITLEAALLLTQEVLRRRASAEGSLK